LQFDEASPVFLTMTSLSASRMPGVPPRGLGRTGPV